MRSRTSVARGQIELTEHFLLCNRATKVSRRAPAERRNAIQALYSAGYVWKTDQSELNETKDKLPWYLTHHPVKSPHKLEKVRRECNAAAKYCGVALFDKLLSGPDKLHSLIRNIFVLPRTPNRFISRHRSDVSSNNCPMSRQPMSTISWARRTRANDGSLQVHTTRFRGEKLADLCKLSFAPSGKRKCSQR